MIIDRKMLRRFNACSEQAKLFEAAYPDGLDVSGLWGTSDERAATWLRLLQSEIIKHNLGWAISAGLIPARITTDLRGADLRWADLNGADLSWADLRGANLRGANLNGANLNGANLSWADLNGANLNGANLSWADLNEANLRGANLNGANLNEANLRGADLNGANLNEVIHDAYTLWPNGYILPNVS